jgi:hypothetical protein
MIMQTLFDFLTFKHFVTADILIFCYYIGAVIFPFGLYFSRNYLRHKIPWINQLYADIMSRTGTLPSHTKLLGVIFFLLMLCMMEIAWRMMFEMMIGYFQMHDYLQTLAAPR